MVWQVTKPSDVCGSSKQQRKERTVLYSSDMNYAHTLWHRVSDGADEFSPVLSSFIIILPPFHFLHLPSGHPRNGTAPIHAGVVTHPGLHHHHHHHHQQQQQLLAVRAA